MNSPIIRSPAAPSESYVQVDLSNMIGAIKPPPVCVDATLKQEAMNAEELSKFTFRCEALKPPVVQHTADFHAAEPSVVSSSSSTGSRESVISDLEGGSRLMSTPVRLEKKQSELINLRVTNQKTSRQGRQGQRWFSDPTSQKVHRLCTGCVPILEGGRILFISSAKKADWILPKGGWEKDETMEESAIRECFEEAGVLGILGPLLSNIDFETRKAKKRRLELEELQRKTKVCRELSVSPSSPASEPEKVEQIIPKAAGKDLSADEITTIPGSVKPSDETCSVASDSSQRTHSHVRMSLFPLYVSEIKSEWPESGRFRKAVGIDEAIEICVSRPELQAVLREVKEKNLHFPPGDLPLAKVED
jgi:diphosphoinositol-polyphosphate diphosphatase